MKTPSISIPLIEAKIDEAWDTFFMVQSTPHDNHECFLEKKQMLKQVEMKIQSLNFDLNILKHARGL